MCQSLHFLSLCRSEHSGTSTDHYFSSELRLHRDIIKSPYFARMLSGGGANRYRCKGTCIKGQRSYHQAKGVCSRRSHHAVLKSPYCDRMLSGGGRDNCLCKGNCTSRRCSCSSALRLCTDQCHYKRNHKNCRNPMIVLGVSSPPVSYTSARAQSLQSEATALIPAQVVPASRSYTTPGISAPDIPEPQSEATALIQAPDVSAVQSFRIGLGDRDRVRDEDDVMEEEESPLDMSMEASHLYQPSLDVPELQLKQQL